MLRARLTERADVQSHALHPSFDLGPPQGDFERSIAVGPAEDRDGLALFEHQLILPRTGTRCQCFDFPGMADRPSSESTAGKALTRHSPRWEDPNRDGYEGTDRARAAPCPPAKWGGTGHPHRG